MKSVAFVVSSPLTVNSFMVEHIHRLSEAYNVTVIANGDISSLDKSLKVNFIRIPIVRNISIGKDLIALYSLCKVLKEHNFNVVHSITPKAGLIGMLAAYICKVPNRFHTFTGQVWVTRTGFFRWLLKSLDKLIFKLTSFALVDSPSQRDFLIEEDVINSSNSRVLGKGSISGVNVSRFKYSESDFFEVRSEFNVPKESFLYLFLGRLCKDKGIDELISAFQIISKEDSNSYLMLVGPNESDYNTNYFAFLNNPKIIPVGLTSVPEKFFNAADVLVLPSYREGFGTTILEAASCGIPSIASNIYGLSDAVTHNETGLLHEVKSIESLTENMSLVNNNKELTKTLGENARKRVMQDFTSESLSFMLLSFYKEKVGV